MSSHERIELAKRKVEDAELALKAYLRKGEYTEEGYQELSAEAKAARRHLADEMNIMWSRNKEE
jgi:hypothetical protein